MSKLVLTMIAALAPIAGAVTPAAAQDDTRPSVAVRYDDLNLASAEGRKRLDTRVRVAIERMCDVDASRELSQRRAAAECAEDARRSIDTQMASLLNGNGSRFGERPPVAAAR